MKMKLFITILSLFILGTSSFSQVTTVRLKEVGKIIESRENQLMGYGLVVGLKGTGDARSSGLTNNAMRNLLSKMGVAIGGVNLNSRNIASVMVTTDLPAFIKKGQRVPVTVSALGDATSLKGGTLIMTPLLGPDMQTYAVAQGIIVVDGVNTRSATTSYQKNQSTVGVIPDGAIVEIEVPVTFTDQHNITIVLDEPNFEMVSRATKSIQTNGYPGAKAIDANTIKVPLSDLDTSDLISTIAELQNMEIEPDESAKIVINSKTGTIIIGERVRLFPVAITHGGMSIRINNDAGGLFAAQQDDPIQITQDNSKLVYINPSDTLSSLVGSLNQLGASPHDLISILQALEESGSLVGELEIL